MGVAKTRNLARATIRAQVRILSCDVTGQVAWRNVRCNREGDVAYRVAWRGKWRDVTCDVEGQGACLTV